MSTRPIDSTVRPGRHEERPSDMERTADGNLRFRPRCSCGWIGDAVDQSRVIALWDAHAAGSNGRV